METVFLSLTKSDFQDLIAETVTACLRRNQTNTQTASLKSGTATRLQAAEHLNISLPTLAEYTKLGKIKGQRIGRRVLYKWDDLEAALTAIKTEVAA